MSLIEMTEKIQTDNNEIAASVNFLPNGRFAPGNKVGVGGHAGRGYQKISNRMAMLANEKSSKQIADIVANVEEFGKLTAAECVALKRVNEAVNGERADAEFLIDRIEGKPTNKTELTGKDGNPLAVMTADVTNLILEIADDMGDV